ELLGPPKRIAIPDADHENAKKPKLTTILLIDGNLRESATAMLVFFFYMFSFYKISNYNVTREQLSLVGDISIVQVILALLLVVLILSHELEVVKDAECKSNKIGPQHFFSKILLSGTRLAQHTTGCCHEMLNLARNSWATLNLSFNI
uniref:Uncharacterized protein n=1 Tax=Cucumis melo TaxID=3656 RepID=A0A9I9E5E5_CUCME